MRRTRPSYGELYEQLYSLRTSGPFSDAESRLETIGRFLAARLDPRSCERPSDFVRQFVHVRTLLLTQTVGRPLIRRLHAQLTFAAEYAAVVERAACGKLQRAVLRWLYRPWRGADHVLPFHVKSYRSDFLKA